MREFVMNHPPDLPSAAPTLPRREQDGADRYAFVDATVPDSFDIQYNHLKRTEENWNQNWYSNPPSKPRLIDGIETTREVVPNAAHPKDYLDCPETHERLDPQIARKGISRAIDFLWEEGGILHQLDKSKAWKFQSPTLKAMAVFVLECGFKPFQFCDKSWMAENALKAHWKASKGNWEREAQDLIDAAGNITTVRRVPIPDPATTVPKGKRAIYVGRPKASKVSSPVEDDIAEDLVELPEQTPPVSERRPKKPLRNRAPITSSAANAAPSRDAAAEAVQDALRPERDLAAGRAKLAAAAVTIKVAEAMIADVTAKGKADKKADKLGAAAIKAQQKLAKATSAASKATEAAEKATRDAAAVVQNGESEETEARVEEPIGEVVQASAGQTTSKGGKARKGKHAPPAAKTKPAPTRGSRARTKVATLPEETPKQVKGKKRKAPATIEPDARVYTNTSAHRANKAPRGSD